MNEREIASLIEAGQYEMALAKLRAAEADVFDVDETLLGALCAQATARLIASVRVMVGEMVATAINRARGRAD
jgi:hypothetical protein